MSATIRKEPTTGRFWAALPVLLLLSTVVGWSVMMKLALDDPGFGVEPDYYRKATEFDALRKLEDDSRALGWSLDAELTAMQQGADVRIKLRGRGSEPLTGAAVRMVAFHNARSSRLYELVLEERGQGQYVGRLPDGRPGIWELRLHVERAPHEFVSTVRLELQEGGT